MESKRLATIPPACFLGKYSTDFHLVLTQYFLSNQAYHDYYISRRLKGDFIIQDNGAAEKKSSISIDKLIAVALELQPDILVAPDVIYDMTKTLNLTTGFVQAYHNELAHNGIQLIAVPQGKDAEEWLECFNTFNGNPKVDWLGISMFYTPTFGSRLAILKLIKGAIRKPVHLLGCWDNLYSLKAETKFDFVKSVDTAKAIEFALEGLPLNRWKEHKHIDNDYYFTSQHPDYKLIGENIEELKKCLQG